VKSLGDKASRYVVEEWSVEGEESSESESEEKKDQLLRMIGEQKVEIDFLKNALG
jgi:hypothetical protein